MRPTFNRRRRPIVKSEKLINKDVVLDGKPDIVIPRRASIKLATKPQIVVAIPIGCKPVSTVLECPMCTEARKKDPSHPFQYEVSEGFRAPVAWPPRRLPFLPGGHLSPRRQYDWSRYADCSDIGTKETYCPPERSALPAFSPP